MFKLVNAVNLTLTLLNGGHIMTMLEYFNIKKYELYGGLYK